MSLAVDGAGQWRASLERASPIRAADPQGGNASFAPWQALMASAALAAPGETGGNVANEWRARIEPGPAVPAPRVIDDPERVETAEARPPNPAAANSEVPGLFEESEPSFADLLDVINPLQHIPIISSIYREITGDRIGHGARLAGGLLFLGPLGGLSALANIVMVEASGKDIGDHALALFKDDPAPVLAANSSTGSPLVAQKPVATPAPIAEEQALIELLPPGAIPISGRSVEFAQAALRPDRGASFFARGDSPAHPAAMAPATKPAATNDDLPPPPPPPGPIAGPGWKGFYTPIENPAAVPLEAGQQPEPPLARRAHAPDPLTALAAKRSPGALAGALAAPQPMPGAIADQGGWFTDVMLEALSKYNDARRLSNPQAPEAGRQGGVNIVN